MRKNLLNLFLSVSILTNCFSDVYASDALSSQEEQSDQTAAIVSNINNTLPKDVLTIILNRPRVAKDSANVCKIWEEIRCTPKFNIVMELRERRRFSNFLDFTYKKSGIQFIFTPTSDQLNTLFKKIPNIDYLDLSYQSIYDNFMDPDVPGLNGLHTLILKATSVTIASAFNKVYNLNLAKTSISDVYALTEVGILNVSGTDITNKSNISKLINVRTLDVSEIKFTDISALAALPKLQTLIYSDKYISDDPELNVRTLDLTKTPLKDIPNLKIN